MFGSVFWQGPRLRPLLAKVLERLCPNPPAGPFEGARPRGNSIGPGSGSIVGTSSLDRLSTCDPQIPNAPTPSVHSLSVGTALCTRCPRPTPTATEWCLVRTRVLKALRPCRRSHMALVTLLLGSASNENNPGSCLFVSFSAGRVLVARLATPRLSGPLLTFPKGEWRRNKISRHLVALKSRRGRVLSVVLS